MKIIKVLDNNDSRYDQLLEYPDSMSIVEVTRIADAAILKVQDARPEEYTFDELLAELKPHGIGLAEWTVATETW